MSRKYDRQRQLRVQLDHILEAPETLSYLAWKIFRPRPVWVPKFVWRLLLVIVCQPAMSEKRKQPQPQAQ